MRTSSLRLNLTYLDAELQFGPTRRSQDIVTARCGCGREPGDPVIEQLQERRTTAVGGTRPYAVLLRPDQRRLSSS